MKNLLKNLLPLLFFLGMNTVNTFAQDEEPDNFVYNRVEEDSIIYESPVTVTLESESLVRFSSTANVYLHWNAPGVLCTGYDVKYKLQGASSWTTVTTSSLEKVLSSLQRDTNYLYEVVPTGSIDLTRYKLAGMFTTYPQTEPIEVSKTMFNQLMSWFVDERTNRTFCEFFGGVDVNLYEKISFIQKYAFDNEDFVNGGSSTDITDWYPARFSSLDEDTCLPEFATKCRCQVVTRGTNKATPGHLNDVEVKVEPHIVQKIAKGGGDKTFIDRFEAGAAKYVALRQNEGAGGMVYEMSNMEDGDDPTSATTEASEIQFFLACLVRDYGTGSTGPVPDSCDCERPLRVSWEYASNLYVAPEKKSCITSKGAGAQAEDLALVVLLNGKTGELTALDAGKYAVGRKCSTSWNVDWWLALLDVVEAVGGYYVTTLDTNSNNIPTQNQLDAFFAAVDSLIGTPFANSSGSCEEVETQQVLVSGTENLTLVPNEPLIITLMSAYYVRTHGYGCYKSAAAVASDYYLAGVVVSEDTEDPECCADKFGDYIVGSLSYPENGDVEIEAPNTIENRLADVATFIAPFGTWYGFVPNPHTGYILFTNEYDLLFGPSCSIEGGYNRPISNQNPIAGNFINVFPNVANGQVDVTLNLHDKSPSTLSLYDMSGNLIRTFISRELEGGKHNFNFSLLNLPAGSYIMNCRVGDLNTNYPIFIVN